VDDLAEERGDAAVAGAMVEIDRAAEHADRPALAVLPLMVIESSRPVAEVARENIESFQAGKGLAGIDEHQFTPEFKDEAADRRRARS
jgi:hypothetical protein